MNKPVKQQLSRINPRVRLTAESASVGHVTTFVCQDTAHAVDVNVSVNMDGVKVISTDGRVR